jgi:phosphoribosyl 1,2-cyclic phosphodiesterase
MAALGVKIWGCRGSISCSSPSIAKYGGNTTCYEILHNGNEKVIVDGGTGIFPLGLAWSQQKPVPRGNIHVFMSHVHWDHIQGLACCPMMHHPEADLTFYSHLDAIESIVQNIFKEPHFPVRWKDLLSKISFKIITPGETLQLGDLKVATLKQVHPSDSLGFKFIQKSQSLAIMTDHELELMDSKTTEATATFLNDVNLVLHDGMFTTEEQIEKKGWGHSAMDKVVSFCEGALGTESGQIIITHHAPYRSDKDLDDHEVRCQKIAKRNHNILMAQENKTYFCK